MAFTLRPYQLDAIAAIKAAEARGIRRQLAALPTGTGKTVVFVHLIRDRGHRALILVHRDELLQQTIEKLGVVGLIDVGIVKAERDEHDRPIVVASVQTLSRENRLARVTADFETVVVDEAHHATAETYRRVLDYVHAFEPDGPLVTGWTATAERADGTALGEIFQEIVFEKQLLEMIRLQYLCDLRAVQVHLAVDYHQLHTRAGDFIDSEAEALLLAANAPIHVLAAYREHAGDRTRSILFTPTVKVAHLMAATFRGAGIPAEALDASTPIEDRRAILRRFQSGETKVVPNCGILTEGFDCPPTDCIIVARPTKSRPLYIQMVGRGTRRYPGKPNCLLLDVVGASTRHDLQTAATLFGLDPEGTIEHSVISAVGEREAVEQAQMIEGQLVAQRIDLFQQAKLSWVTVSPTHFVLSMGEVGDLHLRQQPAGWAIIHRHRNGTEIILESGLTIEYAQGIGEDTARRLGPALLLDREAKWRQDPATFAQLETLRRCRVRHLPNISKGEAAQLITAAIARFNQNGRGRGRWYRR